MGNAEKKPFWDGMTLEQQRELAAIAWAIRALCEARP
jgi:hypothetical protein